ncbi:haloacid dehalogenase-like hydrolase domain-containing 5 [Mercenaria mercenaria]|uniref:haloacid dehalogenase-like hydrolase domain-containing 5 n=1 Tax=Mercenaria mercenaria TaxID=6596 RepID=UPI001E1D46F5|nr:haloacid dehalogenase-like hydrolase domain-containing 5 [Mercenaria mercenaria]
MKELIKSIYLSDGYSTDSSESSEGRRISDSFEDEADFGVLFDVDGVLARGSTPLSAAQQAIRLLEDDEGRLKVPVAFVTNACNRSNDKATQIQKWLNIQVTPDQVIHAPTPARLLTDFHDKHVLVVGQEYRVDIAKDLGFTNVCTIEDVQRAYPLLDMVDHEHRNVVATGSHPDDPTFPPVEAVLLIGEPTHWESHLQLLVDLLLTEGVPNSSHAPKSVANVKQLPVIACNMDLVFMHQACMPRFGHGAFLVCLEALYKKITGRDLEYRALIGKPCEITYRYAEHVIGDVARRLGITRPIRKLYFVGDNPNVDIVGANLYDRYLKKAWQNRENGNMDEDSDSDHLPVSRSIPKGVNLYEQTVRSMESLLVGTGVFKPEETTAGSSPSDDVYHGHRDILNEPELTKPSRFVPDVFHGIQHILKQENFNPCAMSS